MTCPICKGKGSFVTTDYTPDGIEYYREKCPKCQPNFELVPAELIRVEGQPGYIEDRETRIASGYASGYNGGGQL